uniref:F-box domain-containing protein n=1 Tax=Steinernema glaseri TaxID=37863 RepID=A0A1I8ADK9_9BILA
MDCVPLAFCEHLLELLRTEVISKARRLTGSYGELAQHAFENWARYACLVENGSQVGDYMEFATGRLVETPEEIAAVPKKFVRIVCIFLSDTEIENVSREVIRRFPYAVDYSFVLESSSISEAWVDFAYSLKRLRCVRIMKKLDDDALRLFQKLVTSRKLFRLVMHPDACEGRTMEIPKFLLCQEQFTEVKILHRGPDGLWKTAPIRELLEFWTENREKLRGKCLTVEGNCRSAIDQLGEFLAPKEQGAGIQISLKVCSKEECDFINKEYQYNNSLFAKPSNIYKFEEGRESDKRLLYIVYSRLNMSGLHDDLSLMRDTTFFRILLV